jgi:hypothetical protein
MPSGPRSRRLPEPWIFFIDRSLGGQVVGEALRAAGEQVEVHDDPLTAALPAIKKTLRRFPVPFIAGVSVSGDIHVFEDSDQRFNPPKRIKG